MIAQAMVGGILLAAAGVTDPGPPNAFDAPEPGVRPPESTHSESGGTRLGGDDPIDARERQ